MSGGSGYKYHVIQFLEAPYKDIADIVCVPKSWVQTFGADVPIVKVSYPDEEPSLTENRVMSRKRKSESWKSFLSVVRYSTDNYENAKLYIQQELNNSKKNKGDFCDDPENVQDATNQSKKTNGDQILLPAKANEKTSISTQNAMSAATINNDACVVGMVDTLGSGVSSKSANTVTLKRKALPDPDKENQNKRFSVNKPDESDNQIAGPSSKALDSSSKNHLSPTPEDSDGDLYTQETPVEKFNDDSTEMITVDQNPSKTNLSLDPKIINQLATSPIFAKWCMLMQELQEVYNNSMFKELINKLLNKDKDCSAPQNNDPTASASSDTTVEAPKLNKDKSNQKPLEEKNTDNDDDKDQPLKKKSLPVDDANQSEESALGYYFYDYYPPLKKEEVENLVPEYDANDSRWTLKYREPALGLVELMPHSGVYVPSVYLDSLNNSRIHPLRPTVMARHLLREIFTMNAFRICSLPGTREKAINRGRTNFRPVLDTHALSVIINYVNEHSTYIDTPSILQGMRSEMKSLINQ